MNPGPDRPTWCSWVEDCNIKCWCKPSAAFLCTFNGTAYPNIRHVCQHHAEMAHAICDWQFISDEELLIMQVLQS